MHGKDSDCQTWALCKRSSEGNLDGISQKGRHVAFSLAIDFTS